MPTTTRRISLLQHRLEALAAISNQLKQLDQRFFWYRLITFLGAWVLAILVRWLLPGAVWLWIFIGMLASFLVVVFFHRRLDQFRIRYKNAEGFFREQLARAQLDWEKIPYRAKVQPDPQHAFMHDLNLVGDRSLLHLLDTCITYGGQTQLQNWLLQPELQLEAIRTRQALVAEILVLPGFRKGIPLTARAAQQNDDELWDDRAIQRWLKRAVNQKHLQELLWLLGGLAVLNYFLLTMNLIAGWQPYWQFSLLLYLGLYFFQYRHYEATFEDAYQLKKDLEPLQTSLLFLETYPARTGSQLAAQLAFLKQPGQNPAGFIRRIVWISSAASLQNNQILSLLVNVLLPWSVIFAYFLERYKHSIQTLMPIWLKILYQLEAATALANFAFLNPEYHFPQLLDGYPTPLFSVKDLGHPLIDKAGKVVNDFDLRTLGEVALISGSNMSGKSTFLRTLGINLVLAYAGTVVNAESLQVGLLRLFTCIQISDSLKDGISYFYAEVRRLKTLLNWLQVQDQPPVFYLIDEIFQGTNHEERRIGSLAYLKALVATHGMGVISTHDIELSRLAEQEVKIHNFNFQDAVTNGRMSFDYRLRPGPSPTTNALKIMALEGLPVPVKQNP